MTNAMAIFFFRWSEFRFHSPVLFCICLSGWFSQFSIEGDGFNLKKGTRYSPTQHDTSWHWGWWNGMLLCFVSLTGKWNYARFLVTLFSAFTFFSLSLSLSPLFTTCVFCAIYAIRCDAVQASVTEPFGARTKTFEPVEILLQHIVVLNSATACWNLTNFLKQFLQINTVRFQQFFEQH